MKRIVCPFHKTDKGESENTPSCVLYPSHFYCFACGAHGPLSKLGEGAEQAPTREVPKENLERALARIQSLPQEVVRGLRMPVDERFYYVVWPHAKFYKKRRKDGVGAKYIAPAGHPVPLFKARAKGHPLLLVVEGELNALSIAQTRLKADIVSPGGTGSFGLEKHLTFYRRYDKIKLLVDSDAAGVRAAIELKEDLLDHTPHVEIVLMSKDANDLLQELGAEGLQRELETMLRL